MDISQSLEIIVMIVCLTKQKSLRFVLENN